MKKLLLYSCLVLMGFGLQAQDTLTTLNAYINNNGSSAVTFDVTTTVPIKITEIINAFNSTASTSDIWIKVGGVGGSGAPLPISTAAGWTQVQTGLTVSSTSTTGQFSIDNLNPISVPANSTIGVCITGAMSYFNTGSTPIAVNTFSDGVVTLGAGSPTNGYGGAVPSLTNHPRGFLGSIVYEVDILGNCANPFTNVVTDSILATSAKVEWTPGAGNSSFYLEYGLAGFTPGTGTTITGTYPGTQPPVYLTGLSVNTDYDYYLGEICNSGADSAYSPNPYSFKTTKLCAPATNLAVTNVLATTADVSWMHAGGANSFTVYYGAGLSQTATSSPYTLTGLSSNTAYNVYVVADCGTTNGLSDSIGPVSFITPCSITTAPFIENFDDTTWVASGGNANNAIDQCWTANPDMAQSAEPFKWMPRSTAPTSGNGPLTDQTGTNFMYCEASGSAAGDIAYLTSPQIDASGLNTPGLYFQQHRFSGATIADMQVQVSNDFGTTWDTVYSVSGDIQTSNSEPWVQEFVNLGAYTGDTIMVRFVQLGNGCCGDAAIDKVEIKESPTCPWPAGLSVPTTTQTTAVVAWTDPSGTTWDLEWGPVGFTQGTGSVMTTSNNPDTLTGLAPNAVYDLYIRANCVSSGNGYSVWIGPIQFKTLCTTQSLPYTQDFTSWEPNCWDITSAGGNLIWDHNTAGHAQARFWSFSSGTATMASPPITISQKAQVKFKWAHLYSATYPDDQMIVRSQVVGSATWDTLVNFVGPTFTNANSNNTTPPSSLADFTQELFYLDSATYVGNDAVFEFIAVTDFGPNLYVDDFMVEAVPNCIPPSNLMASGITSSSAILTWTTNGAGTFNYEYGPTGFGQGTGTVVSGVTALTDTMMNLASNTCYDVYIQADCGSGSTSPWVGPITFCTPCTAQPIPYTEDFTTWEPNCFTITNTGALVWEQNAAGHAQARFWSFSSGVATMASPPITISQKAQVKFKWAHLYSAAYPDDQLVVRAQVLGTTTWDTLINLVGPTFSSPNSANTTPPAQLADFTPELIYLDSTTYVGNDAVFEFIAVTDFGPNLYVDDFVVEAQPSCPDPTNLTATGIQGYEATASWSAASGNQFFIEYGPQGFAQATGGGTYDTTQTTSILITGLTPVTCYDYYVMADCGPNGSSLWVGPFTFCTTVSCPAPTGVNATSITTTTATIDWVSGGASNYNYIIGPSATTTPATGTVVTGTTQPLLITGLTPSTQYSFYIQDSCGVGDVSTWTGPFTFATLCNAFSLNYTEDFTTWAPPAPPLCWDDQGGTQVVLKNGNTAEFNFWGWPSPNDAILTSPAITISQKARLVVSWSSNASTVYNDDMYVLAKQTSATVWDTIDHWDNPDCACGATNTAPSTTPIDSIYTLDSNYVGSDIQVRFHGRSGFGPDVYIHSVTVEVDPAFASCPAPQNLTASNVLSTSADLSWTSAATSFEVSYGMGAFPASAGTKVVTSNNPYALTNLTGNTTYGYYVRAICSATDTSVWNGPFNFTTACTSYTLPFTDNLDGGSWVADNGTQSINSSVDQCWTSNVPANTTYSWRIRTTSTGSGSGATGPLTDKSGTGNYAYTEASSGASGNVAELTSPIIDMSTATAPELTFAYHFYGTAINIMYVEGYDGTTWAVLDSIVGGQQTSGTDPWIDTTVSLMSYAGTANFQFRLRAISQGCCAGDMAIDDFSVTDGPGGGSCVAPTGVATSNVTCTEAELSWTSDMGTLFTFVRFDTTGFDPTTSGTLLINPTSPATLTGLMPGTTYDVWVADSCSLGTAATMYSFTTPSGPLPNIVVAFNQSNTTASTATVDFDASGTTDGDTYTWDFGGGSMASGDTASFVYASNGSFPVTLTVTNGCGSVDSTFNVNVQGISIEETALGQSLSIFPNPNDGNFNVSFTLESSENVELRVLNSAGQIVMKENLGNVDKYDGNIDLSAKAKGMYVLQIETTSGTVNRRVTIQ